MTISSSPVPTVAPRIRDIAHPYIDVLNTRAAELRASGKDVISLGQAIPGFAPPEEALAAARLAMSEPDTHIYSADAGTIQLRRSLSAKLAKDFHIGVDPDREMIITSGGNQAFMLALLTLLEPGDEVLLPTPYYLNHEMGIRTIGCKPVEIPLGEDDGFALTLRAVLPHITSRSRAIVIVSPNNPTGAVYEERELRLIVDEMAARNITVISDETYQHFLYEGRKHFSLGSIDSRRANVVVAGSLSKSFAMTGWRIGYLIAHRAFIEEAMKVQDSMVICASVVGQHMATAAVENSWNHPLKFNPDFNRRRLYLEQRLKSIPALHWTTTHGGFFAFVRVNGCADSIQLSSDILTTVHVVTTPGRIFGRAAEGYIRLSYGSVEMQKLETACNRLEEYFRD